MAALSTAQTAAVTARSDDLEHHSYVDWPAIIAGIVLASAISLVLLTFGSAVGLSLADFRNFDGGSPIIIGIVAAIWLLAVQILSFMSGGYVTGRMRRRFHDATEHESDVRDGIHGLLVWGGALVIGAIIAMNGLSAAVSTIGNAVGTATTAAATAADEAGVDPNAYFADALFRPAAPAGGDAAAPAAAPAAPAGGTPAGGADTRAEASRILATGVTGPVSDTDRAHLATLVSQNTGMPAADAQARVDQVLGQMDQARQTALEAADTARRTGVIAAFLTAASFLASAIGAYWAASMGGRHRDEGTVLSNFFRRY